MRDGDRRGVHIVTYLAFERESCVSRMYSAVGRK